MMSEFGGAGGRFDVSACSLREDDGDDHAVQTEGLTEDKNKDHADEDGLLLSVGSHTSVTYDADSETSCEGGETANETGGEVSVTLAIAVRGVVRKDYNK